MNKDYAKHLLQKTKDDYNRIADKFSSTRGYIPDDIKILSHYSNKGDKVLDLGCGNGRLSEIFFGKSIDYTGVDFSKDLINIAKKKYPKEKFLLSNALLLPFTGNKFNVVYALSVFHHIPSLEYRKKFLLEIKRILAPNGILVLTVWNLRKKSEIKAELSRNFIKRVVGVSKFDAGDVFLPFHSEGKTIMRYLHCFTQKELKSIVLKTGYNIEEERILQRGKKLDNENLLIVGKK